MNLIDLHCDSMFRLHYGEKKGEKLTFDECLVNMDGLRKSNSLIQFFASFIFLGQFKEADRYTRGYEEALVMLERLHKELNVYSDEISVTATLADLEENMKRNKISAVSTIEEGGILENSMDRLQTLYEKGVRLITLLWNYENCLGFPNGSLEGGLKPFGIQVVEEMNQWGMIVDVSHLSDQGFWDVNLHSKQPFIASHSNAREVCRHQRNLTDDMLRALGNAGGVAGLNLYPIFLGQTKDSKIQEMVAHIQHMMKMGGEEVIAIGTDFDGFDGIDTMEIQNIGEMNKLYVALHKAGLSELQLEKLWYKNALRVIQDVLK